MVLRQVGEVTFGQSVRLPVADRAAQRGQGLPALELCVRDLLEVSPVHAFPGNHDERTGLAEVEAGGLHWLPDRPFKGSVQIGARIDPAAHAGRRLLCTRHHGDIPAAAAGYGLVLAGHLQGGKCVLATRRGRLYPPAWIYRWHGLRFAEWGVVLLASRGTGETLPLRFNCSREMIPCAYLTVWPTDALLNSELAAENALHQPQRCAIVARHQRN